MTLRLLPSCLAMFVLLVIPPAVEADVCEGDYWGGIGADIQPTIGLGMRISGLSQLFHGSGHTESCSGTHKLKIMLGGFTGTPACDKQVSQSVTHDSGHGILNAEETCIGEPGKAYTGKAMRWWNDDVPDSNGYEETEHVVTIPDSDDDNYSPNAIGSQRDCNDSNAGINPGVELYPGSVSCNWLSDYWGDINCNGWYDADDCGYSPVIIDVAGDGFRLTDAAGGVDFDLNGDGHAERLSWTSANGDDAWLVLDRNGNGLIDSGDELFGNFTPQPASTSLNGFKALAVLDANGDGWISATDPSYAQLRLWSDSNHDGKSQESELRTLAAAGLLRLSLDVKESQRRDAFGNRFKYRAKIDTASARDAGPFAYDVYLVGLPTRGVQASVVPKK